MEAHAIRKERRIPARGDVLVSLGQAVEPDTLVARGIVPNPDIREVRLYVSLDVDPEHTRDYMLKAEGDYVERDEVIAIRRSFFGRQTRVARSPITGTVESYSPRSGRALIRGAPIPVEVSAHVPGKVVQIIDYEGAVIEAQGIKMEGLFGVGGEAHGRIAVVDDNRQEPLSASDINESQKGSIVVGGSIVTLDALKAAQRAGVKGIITGGVDQKDLTYFIGREIGLGVTGDEKVGLTLILLGGFGVNLITPDVFRFFKDHEGRLACIDGSTQIRSRITRPEIIVPEQ